MSRSPVLPLIVTLAIVVLTAPNAAARDRTPAPAGGGPGVHLFPADQMHPLDLPAPDRAQLRPAAEPDPLKAGDRSDDLGGDDVRIDTYNWCYDDDLAVASNGDLFSLVMYSPDDDNNYLFEVHRSDDSGTTWRQWAVFTPDAPDYRFERADIVVAEGDEDRVFVAYVYGTGFSGHDEVHVAWSPLDLYAGDFSNDTTIHTVAADWVSGVSLTTDAANWSDYYCYLTYSANDGNGHDIHFTRSTNQGTDWATPYVIGTIAVSDRGYYRPQVAVGYGGWVHVAWFLGFDMDHEYDNTIRYRRCPSYANGGLAAWENMQSLTPHTDDIDMIETRLAASWVGPDLMMSFMRRERYPDGSYAYDGIMSLASDDAGEHWTGPTVVGSGFDWLGDLLHQEVNSRWVLGVNVHGGWEIRTAPTASPSDWSEEQDFADCFYQAGEPSVALDPSHDDRLCVVGGGRNQDDTFTYYFDAEWRADPGYPNYDPGFPVSIPDDPQSDPAVVDLDGDGYLEIVFSSWFNVEVYRHDGTIQPGWPVSLDGPSPNGPVAVGDLNGDGEMEVVVGSADGRVFVFHPDGTLMDGWPADALVSQPVYVSIGAVGGPYPRAVLAVAGHTLCFKDWRGERYPGSINRGFGTYEVRAPAAIGDIDGDGGHEVVIAADEYVFAFPMDYGIWEIQENLGSMVRGGVALADLDNDGDEEIIAALANGDLTVLDDDGSTFPGDWPVDAGTGSLNGVAVAQMLGTWEPEIAVTSWSGQVSVYYYDGDLASGWPEVVDHGAIHSHPVIGRVDGSSSDVVVASYFNAGWAWSNISALIPGWPKPASHRLDVAPAYGDLDLDGNAEVVFLDRDQLMVVDIGSAHSDDMRTWAMVGHDPARTHCWECTEDVVAVEEATDGVTRVSLAAPWPNPIAGQATFAYAVPVRARVQLVVYDVRGRRIATVHRAEEDPGRHTIAWNGRDDDGRLVASGQYVAALRVTGPGVDETVARKVTVLR